jgi:hypothetical protein
MYFDEVSRLNNKLCFILLTCLMDSFKNNSVYFISTARRLLILILWLLLTNGIEMPLIVSLLDYELS